MKFSVDPYSKIYHLNFNLFVTGNKIVNTSTNRKRNYEFVQIFLKNPVREGFKQTKKT